MRTGAALTVVALLVVAGAAPMATGAVADGGVPERADPATVIVINLTADGDAEWAIESRFRLEDDGDVEAFREFADDVENGGTTVGYSEETVRRFVAQAEAATGREMAIEDARWTTRTTNDTGVVTFRFRWTNFARTDGSRVVFGDAFGTNRTWFPALTDDQRLVVNAPSGYAVLSAPPDRGPEEGTITWEGPHQFSPGEIHATYVPVADPTTTTAVTTTPPTTSPTPGTATTVGTTPGVTTTPAAGGNLPPVATWLGVALLIALVGVGGYALARREPDGDGADEGDEIGPAAGAAAAGDGAEAGAADESEEAAEAELLSDEERVERLLEDNGGRMRQSNIVSETGWSNAKVSQLLSAMDEEGRIDKLRIGRENLITLPDEDVGDFES